MKHTVITAALLCALTSPAFAADGQNATRMTRARWCCAWPESSTAAVPPSVTRCTKIS